MVPAQRLHQRVQQAREVVLGVVEGLGRDRERVVDHVPPALRRELERVLQHLDEVVAHQHRLVLVHREPDVALARAERDVDPPFLEPRGAEQLVDPLDESEPRVAEVDRVDRVARHGHPERGARHHPLLVVGDDRRLALAPRRAVRAVEVDEVDGRRGPVAVGDAVAHARADEGQVRVGVPGLGLLLLVAELAPELHLVVAVAAVGREERVPGVEELREAPVMVVHAAGEALVQVARGRVQRAVERAAVAAQEVAGLGADPLVDVDRLEAPAGVQDEANLCGCGGHASQSLIVTPRCGRDQGGRAAKSG